MYVQNRESPFLYYTDTVDFGTFATLRREADGGLNDRFS